MNIQGFSHGRNIQQMNMSGIHPPKERPSEYIIKKGETLYSIAKKFNMSVEDFCKWTGVKKESILKTGQKINLPQAEIPDRCGLLTLVNKYHMSKETFCDLNNMTISEFNSYKPQKNEKFYVYDGYKKSTGSAKTTNVKTEKENKSSKTSKTTNTEKANVTNSGFEVVNLPEKGYFPISSNDRETSVRVKTGNPRAVKDASGTYVSETMIFEPFNPNTGKLKNKKIMVNAGHGIKQSSELLLDPGMEAKDENNKTLQEWRKNRDYADELIKLLREEGATVIFTNGDAKNACDAKRKFSCDMFLSLHCNASDHKDAKGMLVFYPKIKDNKRSKAFGESIAAKFGCKLKKDDEGQNNSIGVLRVKSGNVTVPSILLEMGFMTNPTDIKNIDSPIIRHQNMQTLKDGIIEFFEETESDSN